MTDYYPEASTGQPEQTTSINTGKWSNPNKPQRSSGSVTAKDIRPKTLIDGWPLASKAQRLGAYWIDWVSIFALPLLIFTYVLDGALAFAAQPVMVLWLLAILALYGALSGMPGGWNFQSPGKRIMKIQAVRPVQYPLVRTRADNERGFVQSAGGQTFAAPGVGRGMLRLVLHCMDTFCVLGMISIAVSPYHRTLADALTKTVHVELAGADHSALPAAPSGSTNLT